MSTRVGVVLSGCGSGDGSEISEAILAMYWIERSGGRVICLAPDTVQERVVDHLTQAPDAQAGSRRVMAEAARIARGQVRDIASVGDAELDAIIFPGGHGVSTILSNYAEKGVVCDVHPEVTRLLKALLLRRRPMGFICMAPILAARVLGPVSGVRITLGTKASVESKHAAVMGADVRPCPVREILFDQKSRVVSTPAYMVDDARLSDVAMGIERLVRQVVALTRDCQQRPQAAPGPSAQKRPPAAAQAASNNGGVVVRRQPNRDNRRSAIRPGGGSS